MSGNTTQLYTAAHLQQNSKCAQCCQDKKAQPHEPVCLESTPLTYGGLVSRNVECWSGDTRTKNEITDRSEGERYNGNDDTRAYSCNHCRSS